MRNLVCYAFMAAALLLVAEAASLSSPIEDKSELKEIERTLISDMRALIETDLTEMDDKVRDGFLSNLSAALTNAIEAIRERLPEMPEFLRPATQPSLPFAANLAEDED